MRVAISTDGGYVSPHFGRCPQFTIVDVESKQITNRETIENPGHIPGLIPEYLSEKGVQCIIAGGMGRRAEELFIRFGINTIVGVSGTVDETIDKFIRGDLKSGKSTCVPGKGKGYGLDKNECDHTHDPHADENCK